MTLHSIYISKRGREEEGDLNKHVCKYTESSHPPRDAKKEKNPHKNTGGMCKPLAELLRKAVRVHDGCRGTSDLLRTFLNLILNFVSKFIHTTM